MAILNSLFLPPSPVDPPAKTLACSGLETP
jgi:hypothetical protein